MRIPLSVNVEACGDEVAGWTHGVLNVHVVARPGFGRANAAVERLLAEVLGVPMRRVKVVDGHYGAHKLVAITGLDEDDLELALPGRYAQPGGDRHRPSRLTYI